MKEQNHHQIVYYAARSGFYDTVKIGTTNNLTRRLKALRKKYGEELEILAVEKDPSTRIYSMELEAKRHTQFRKSAIIGEWFWATPDLTAHILALPYEVEAYLP